MSEDEQWEKQRESMYYGSLKNHLVTTRLITKTVYDPISFEDFRRIMIEKSPVFIYNTMWSEKNRLYEITKQIYPSDEGITFICKAWADKSPKFKSFQDFYNMLLSEGIEYIKF